MSRLTLHIIIIIMTREGDQDGAVRNVSKLLFDKSPSPPLKLHLLLHIARYRRFLKMIFIVITLMVDLIV